MTLIVALRGVDGLVLASDSRGTIGDPRGLTAINDTYKKIFELSKHCGLGVAGSSELGAKFVDDLVPRLQVEKCTTVDSIMNETRKMARQSYKDWVGALPPDQRPPLLLILAGYERASATEPIPKTYLLASNLDFAPQLFPQGNCLAGVVQYAVYLLHRFYDQKMKILSLSRLAAYLIVETASQDPKVGGPISLAQITPKNGYEELDSAAIDQILVMNQKQNEALRQFFLEGAGT